ncbi:MAG TPA: CHASE3 domain-containing protein [Gemmatimonadaceae bacterium]|nr:CHASE3 domain-containing protein [Gemmatimonadaceae bacterium]
MANPTTPKVDGVPSYPSENLFARPMSRWQRVVASSGVAIVVLVIGVITYNGIVQARDAGVWVEHTHQTIDRTRATLSDLKDAETGQRGFILTGDEAYLEPYTNALTALAADTSALRLLTADNQVQQRYLDELAPLVTARLAELDYLIDLRRTQGLEAALARLRTNRGKQIMDSIRTHVATIESAERSLLATRSTVEGYHSEVVTLVLVGGTLAAVLIAIVLNGLLTRYADTQSAAARALALQNTRLESQTVELEMQNQQLQEQASELELQQQHLHEQATELEAQNEQLQQQTTELERQTEELHAVAGELAGRTMESERARVAAEQAQLVAESANRAKAEFLATMSHELRTPLNAISGYVDLMQLGIRGAVTPEQLDDLARIKKSGRHLLALINDILNFAKLEAGKVDFNVADTSVLELVGGVEALVSPQMHARGIRIVYERCGPDIATRADAEKVQQILLNLLTNAQKFTPSGGRIGITCAAADDVVSIAVSDTGRGIPADKLESIFEPFVQVDRHLATDTVPYSQRGIGLGLAISRELARAMGGDIAAESIVGQGSVFTLTLPRGIPVDALPNVAAIEQQGTREAIDAGREAHDPDAAGNGAHRGRSAETSSAAYPEGLDS